jgi:hypothetical protein
LLWNRSVDPVEKRSFFICCCFRTPDSYLVESVGRLRMGTLQLDHALALSVIDVSSLSDGMLLCPRRCFSGQFSFGLSCLASCLCALLRSFRLSGLVNCSILPFRSNELFVDQRLWISVFPF